MTDFDIHFYGLVCFFAPEPRGGNPLAPKTMALFVRDIDHERRVTTADRIPRAVNFQTISMAVTGGTPGVIACTDRSFQSGIPHLADDNVTRGGITIDEDLAIKLLFPPVAGRLLAGEPFPRRGNYQLAQRNMRRDVASFSVLRITAEALTITCDGIDIPIDPDAPRVKLGNNSDEGGYSTDLDPCGNHFRRYSSILRTPTGSLTNCLSVAHVVDDNVPSAPDPGAVPAIPSFSLAKSAATVPIPRPEHRPLQQEGGGLGPGSNNALVADAALQLINHVDTVLQTQCSNTNWP